MPRARIVFNKEQFIQICKQSKSMMSAAAQLGIHFNTFKRYAVKYDVYKTNQSCKGIKKDYSNAKNKFKLDDILDGKHPQYSTYKLKIRLIKEKLIENKCGECDGDPVWNGLPLSFELNHIDGNKYNHNLKNLQLLCPNCHSQTDTFRSKNKGQYRLFNK